MLRASTYGHKLTKQFPYAGRAKYFTAFILPFLAAFTYAALRGIENQRQAAARSQCLVPASPGFTVPRTSLGFDFRTHNRLPGTELIGFATDENFALATFTSRDGTELSNLLARTNFILLMLVDEKCLTVFDAVDKATDINLRLLRANIPYAAISVPRDPGDGFLTGLLRDHRARQDRASFFESAERIGLEVPLFFWSASTPAPESLRRMPKPSHLFVSSEGRVLHSWVGTSADPAIRERMANQIVSDVLQLHILHNSMND
jgi:hypothetical protein